MYTRCAIPCKNRAKPSLVFDKLKMSLCRGYIFGYIHRKIRVSVKFSLFVFPVFILWHLPCNYRGRVHMVSTYVSVHVVTCLTPKTISFLRERQFSSASPHKNRSINLLITLVEKPNNHLRYVDMRKSCNTLRLGIRKCKIRIHYKKKSSCFKKLHF